MIHPTRDSRFHMGGLVALVVLLFLLGGCASGAAHRAAKDNDRLRRQNLKLQEQVKQLRQVVRRYARQQAKAAQGKHSAEGEGNLPQAVHPTRLELGRYSSALDTNDDGHDDLLRLYVSPLDREHRFVPVAGSALVQLASFEADGSVRLIARQAYDAQAWNHAYRSGFTGTHYTLEIKLPASVIGKLKQVTAKVTVKAVIAKGQVVTLTGQNVFSLQ